MRSVTQSVLIIPMDPARSWATAMKSGFASCNRPTWPARLCSMARRAPVAWKSPPSRRIRSRQRWRAAPPTVPAVGHFRRGRNETEWGRLTPQLGRGDIGAVAQGGQLLPHNRGRDPFAAGKRAEAAIGGGNHALAIDHHVDRFQQAPRHDLRVLDKIRGGVDDAGHEQPVLRQGLGAYGSVFMLMAGVGELDR